MSESKVPNETAMVKAEPSGLDWVRPQSLHEMLAFADRLAGAKIVPLAFQKDPASILVAAAMGKRLGLDPVASLSSINVIHGRPGLSADALVAVCLAHPSCHYFRSIEITDSSATWETLRRGSEPERRSFSIEDAKRAGYYDQNPQYRSRPARMLSARAKAMLAKDVYPDVVAGFSTVEELEDERAQSRAAEPLRESYAEKARARQRAKAAVQPLPEPDPAPAIVVVEAEVQDDDGPFALTHESPLREDGPPPQPKVTQGRNRIAVVENWREFVLPDGALLISPRGTRPGTPIDEFAHADLANAASFIESSLRSTDYVVSAERYGLDWLTADELRAMDTAHLAGIRRTM